MSRIFKTKHFSHACLVLLALQNTYAQTTPSAADVLRSIEQYRPEQNKSPTKASATKMLATKEKSQGVDKLRSVIVRSPLYAEKLSEFWRDEIGNSISSEKQNEFNAFAWELFQRKGYLPYITSKIDSSPTGSTLNIYVNFPRIREISITTTDDNNDSEFINEVMHRFTAAYKSGMPVDVQGFENQLSAAMYDLPVDLDVSLRQVNESELDVIIYLRSAEHIPGKILGGFLQSNNYGLSQFGPNQVLGNVRLAGFTPLSELTLTTQLSHGISYVRTDYELPIEGTNSRLRMYGSQMHSHANDSIGRSQEMGAAVTKLLSTDRSGKWFGSAELSNRTNQNWAADVMHSDRVDNQLRFKIRLESSNNWVDNFSNEVVLAVGEMDLGRLLSDKEADASTSGLNVAGIYKKIEMTGSLSQSLDAKHIYTGYIRWRAQAASNNLDGYNRISLGGINGIRAFSPLEGVGDQGAQMSFDIIHQVVPDVFGGLFYDVGVVKNNHHPLANGTDTNAYLLQGIGWQVGGKVNAFNWTLSVAHAFGKTPGLGVWTAANTQIGDFRADIAVTRPF